MRVGDVSVTGSAETKREKTPVAASRNLQSCWGNRWKTDGTTDVGEEGPRWVQRFGKHKKGVMLLQTRASHPQGAAREPRRIFWKWQRGSQRVSDEALPGWVQLQKQTMTHSV